MAIHAAQHYGCRVTTTTISRQQYELARERIAAAGSKTASPYCSRIIAI